MTSASGSSASRCRRLISSRSRPEQNAVPAPRITTTRTRASRSRDRKSTRLNSSHSQNSYAVFCLKKQKEVELNREHLDLAAALHQRNEKECRHHPEILALRTHLSTWLRACEGYGNSSMRRELHPR